jgi:hypothetical protein
MLSVMHEAKQAQYKRQHLTTVLGWLSLSFSPKQAQYTTAPHGMDSPPAIAAAAGAAVRGCQHDGNAARS